MIKIANHHIEKLLIAIGSQLVSEYKTPPAINTWCNIVKTLLPNTYCELPTTKGIGILGSNGLGKSLHAKICYTYIYPYFGGKVIYVYAKQINKDSYNKIIVDIGSVNDIYIDDLGYDERKKDYGNNVDFIADLIDEIAYRNETQTKHINLHFTSNLDTNGYGYLSGRYGARIADRLTAMSTMISIPYYESLRNETTTITPNAQKIRQALDDFALYAMGIDVKKQPLPHEEAILTHSIAYLRKVYHTIKSFDETQKQTILYPMYSGAMDYCDKIIAANKKNEYLYIKEHIEKIKLAKSCLAGVWQEKNPSVPTRSAEEVIKSMYKKAQEQRNKSTLLSKTLSRQYIERDEYNERKNKFLTDK